MRFDFDVDVLSVSYVSSTGTFDIPTVAFGVTGGPGGFTYDVAFQFETSNAGGGVKRFTAGDSVMYQVTTSAAPEVLHALAHVQSTFGAEGSSWIKPGPGTTPFIVPEPHEYAMLAGLGLVAFGIFRRWKQ
jgi:hypothetical protein